MAGKKAALPISKRASDASKYAGKIGIGTGPVPIQRWTMHAVPTVSPSKKHPAEVQVTPKGGSPTFPAK